MRAKALAKGQSVVNHEADTNALELPPDHQITMAKTAEWDLEKYRPLLLLQARQLQQDPRLLVRFGWSDLVQQTLLEAHHNRDDFRGPEGARIQWLRQILRNTAIDRAIHERAGRRDVHLEQTLGNVVADSSARIDNFLADRGSSPSERCQKEELLVHLAQAIEQLPIDQREVLVGRDLLGKPIREIAAGLKKSERAVAGLLYRAHKKLRELMAPFEER
jgi:RNA polymerase sigma-70 factor, ECF subfamily